MSEQDVTQTRLGTPHTEWCDDPSPHPDRRCRRTEDTAALQAAAARHPVPTVGRMVHYRSYGTPGGEYTSQCRAATIAEVGAWMTTRTVPDEDNQQRVLVQMWDPEACALVVQNPTGQFFNTCRHAEATPDDPPYGFPGGTWHWPCVRV